MGKPIVIAMSGGVDSSVSAHLLKEAGWEPIGLFMDHGGKSESESNGTRTNRCCSLTDSSDASSVAAKLNIPFYSLNYKSEFGKIMDYFVAEYRQGRTPIPCVLCNQWLKFGSLLSFAKSLGIDYVATGHYARVEHDTDYSRILVGKDKRKDQTYFMMGLTHEQIKNIHFPLANYTKPEVREIARSIGLSVANKAESMEICFVPGNDYREFINKYSPGKSVNGNILDIEGNIVGNHTGIENFTVGQRHGIGVSFPYPVYVQKIDPQTHNITVAKKEHMFSRTVKADRVVWSDPASASIDSVFYVQTRHNSDLKPATIKSELNHVVIDLHDPQFAVQAGQAAVWYLDTPRGMQMAGGGWITL